MEYFSCVCERFIYSQNRSTYFPAACRIGKPTLGIYKTLTDTWMCKMDGGRTIPFLGIQKWDFRCSVLVKKKQLHCNKSSCSRALECLHSCTRPSNYAQHAGSRVDRQLQILRPYQAAVQEQATTLHCNKSSCSRPSIALGQLS